jgi:hypothetical protein
MAAANAPRSAGSLILHLPTIRITLLWSHQRYASMYCWTIRVTVQMQKYWTWYYWSIRVTSEEQLKWYWTIREHSVTFVLFVTGVEECNFVGLPHKWWFWETWGIVLNSIILDNRGHFLEKEAEILKLKAAFSNIHCGWA